MCGLADQKWCQKDFASLAFRIGVDLNAVRKHPHGIYLQWIGNIRIFALSWLFKGFNY